MFTVPTDLFSFSVWTVSKHFILYLVNFLLPELKNGTCSRQLCLAKNCGKNSVVYLGGVLSLHGELKNILHLSFRERASQLLMKLNVRRTGQGLGWT